jgi:hypothetical protein
MRKLKKVHGRFKINRISCGDNGLNPGTSFGTNEVGEFVSNYILNKDDLLYFNDVNVHRTIHHFLEITMHVKLSQNTNNKLLDGIK